MRIRAATLLATGALVALSGCGGSSQPVETNSVATLDSDAGSASSNDVVAATPTPSPSTAPTEEPTAATAADAADTPEAAEDVVRSYYKDIDSGDFNAAYALWDRGGQTSKQSFDQFKRGFAETASTTVDVGVPTNGEGAAGSVFVDVPVTVSAKLKDGTEQRFTGHYTLRRVNDVDGATAEQLRWHLDSAVLKAG